MSSWRPIWCRRREGSRPILCLPNSCNHTKRCFLPKACLPAILHILNPVSFQKRTASKIAYKTYLTSFAFKKILDVAIHVEWRETNLIGWIILSLRIFRIGEDGADSQRDWHTTAVALDPRPGAIIGVVHPGSQCSIRINCWLKQEQSHCDIVIICRSRRWRYRAKVSFSSDTCFCAINCVCPFQSLAENETHTCLKSVTFIRHSVTIYLLKELVCLWIAIHGQHNAWLHLQIAAIADASPQAHRPAQTCNLQLPCILLLLHIVLIELQQCEAAFLTSPVQGEE